jgi:hypothetical protein
MYGRESPLAIIKILLKNSIYDYEVIVSSAGLSSGINI